MTELILNPDRLFPIDPAARRLARSLYESTASEPIVSPHGHVSARMLADNQPFPDPARLLISSDHYVTRLLHANSVKLEWFIGEDIEDEAPEVQLDEQPAGLVAFSMRKRFPVREHIQG